MSYTKAERDDAQARLREELAKGQKVYCILRNVSRSGMQRTIRLVVFNGEYPRDISRLAAKAVGWGYDERREGIRVGGSGMDMGFHLVSTLSSCLFGNDYALRREWL